MQHHKMRNIASSTSSAATGELAEIPALPFVGGYRPTCTQHVDVFERAAVETRAKNRAERIAAVEADRHTKVVCSACPVKYGCREYGLLTRQKWGVWGGLNYAERVDWLIRNRHLIPSMESGSMSEAERRDALNDVTQIELFSLDSIAMSNTPMERPRRKSARALAYGNCPHCTAIRTPIVAQGEHHVWREHFYTTWQGVVRACLSSGVAVCSLGEDERAEYNGKPLSCPCGREPSDRNNRHDSDDSDDSDDFGGDAA